jgi:hypothetical protein
MRFVLGRSKAKPRYGMRPAPSALRRSSRVTSTPQLRCPMPQDEPYRRGACTDLEFVVLMLWQYAGQTICHNGTAASRKKQSSNWWLCLWHIWPTITNPSCNRGRMKRSDSPEPPAIQLTRGYAWAIKRSSGAARCGKHSYARNATSGPSIRDWIDRFRSDPPQLAMSCRSCGTS